VSVALPPADGLGQEAGAAVAAPEAPDLTGKDRLAWNVLASWVGYLVQVMAGFVLPRLIDHHVGQARLGLWDMGWSFVSYFGLAQLGVGSSVNRYVAKHRATGDVIGLRRVASSVVGLNLASAVIILMATAGAARIVPWLLGPGQAGDVGTARWVIVLLGASLALSTSCDVFPGVITGCHRWDVHTAVTASGQVVVILGMVLALGLGGGLVGVAFANLVGTAVMESGRMLMAYRVCPELQIRRAYADREQARRLFAFGAKYSVGGLARVLLVQTNNLVLLSTLGSAALAVFARPIALVRVVETLANKFSFVFTPTASSLQGSGRQAELIDLVLTAARWGTALVAPLSLCLAVLADPILRLWMGPRYEHGLLLTILVVGSFLSFTQRPVGMILAGLNLHGRLAFVSLAAAALGCGLALQNARLGGGLVGFALCIAVPTFLSTGLFLPFYACRTLGIPLTQFFRNTYLLPLACCVPLAVCLVASRVVLGQRPLLAIGVGCCVGGAVTGWLYWRHLVPAHWKAQVGDLLIRRIATGGARRPPE